MELKNILELRQSTRSFTDQPLTEDQIRQLLLAANRAPIGSSMYQDIHLTVVQDQDILLQLCQAAWERFSSREKMKEIAGEAADRTPDDSPQAKPNLFYGAPVVIFVSHRKQTVQPGIEYSNAACVVNQMHLAATDMGLGSCYMWGALESIRMLPHLDNTHLLQLPKDFEPLIGLAVGYPQQPLDKPTYSHKPMSVNYIGGTHNV